MLSAKKFLKSAVNAGLFSVLLLGSGCSLRGVDARDEPVQASDLTPTSWVALGKSGPSHRLLDMFAGSWNTRTTVYGGDAQGMAKGEVNSSTSTHSGRAKISWILGDRFLKEDFEGEMIGARFQGLGLMGYDNGGRRFTNVWADSLSTAMVFAHGKYFAEQNRFEFTGNVYDPLLSRERTVRTTIDIISPREYVVTTFEPDQNGLEMKTLEIRYEKAA